MVQIVAGIFCGKIATQFHWNMNTPFGFRLAFSIVIPVLIVNRGYKKKSLNLSGALSSLIVGFLLTFANFCFFSALFAFFVSGSFLTKLKADVKRDIEYDFKEGLWVP